jgi:hypothetical protein
MNSMKQLTRNILEMSLNGIDLADVAKIEFAFSQNIHSTPLKVAEFPGDGVLDLGNNILGVIWTPEETMLFEAGKSFYADTRITMNDTEYQPETPIVKLQMNPTLFEGAVV